jgi:sodium/bile acid cotransporter 7
MNVKTALQRIRPDWFIVGIGFAICLPWLLPDPGAPGGILQPQLLNQIGLAVIFFLNGVSLSFTALKTGLLNWRAHLAIQGSTFLLFPLLGLLLSRLTVLHLPTDLSLGFFYLCVLPSTVSSSVVLTALAGGNVPIAVFNAALSSLIGIVITPAWIAWTTHSIEHTLSFRHIVLDLLVYLVLPLVVGQLVRPQLGDWIAHKKAMTRLVDRGIILILIYTAFCASMKQGLWKGHGAGLFVEALSGTVLIFSIMMFSIGAISKALGFSWEDRIAIMFCGSKKGLAFGIALAPMIFGTTPALSFIVLPLILYHPFQIVACSTFVGWWKRHKKASSPLNTRADQ